jgi:hypothetical protein
MDKGEQYIRMCEEACEIQKLWMPKHGDYFADRSGKVECWVSHIHDRMERKNGFYIKRETGLVYLIKLVWLPRFDQLIELAQVKGRRYENTTHDFFRWTKTPYKTMEGLPQKIFSSLEQIWLAFVMHQKFWKKWNGSRWYPLVGRSA